MSLGFNSVCVCVRVCVCLCVCVYMCVCPVSHFLFCYVSMYLFMFPHLLLLNDLEVISWVFFCSDDDIYRQNPNCQFVQISLHLQ